MGNSSNRRALLRGDTRCDERSGRRDQGDHRSSGLSRSLPAMKGGNLKITVLEVTYAPAAASQAHSHPCPVVAYVVSGAIRSQVQGEPEAVYGVGESFFEPANGVHVISAKASRTAPAKFLAYFLCDHETKLSVPPVDGSKGNAQQRHTNEATHAHRQLALTGSGGQLCARALRSVLRFFPALPTASDSTVGATLAMEILQALYVIPRK
jgi:quercetin dioxygenase-like cupin family protein